MLKFIAGFNQHGKRIKEMNKYNKTACCPLCGEEEDWEHVIKCPEKKMVRDKWLEKLGKDIKKVSRHKYAGSNEKLHAKEMILDAKRYFDDDEEELFTNKQIIRIRSLFRGAVVR